MASEGTATLSPKRRKTEEECGNHKNGTETSNVTVFKGFKIKRVLSDVAERKVIFVHGKFEDVEDSKDGDAVVILEKTPFNEECAQKMLSEVSDTKLEMKNDIYSTMQLYPPAHLNGIKTTLIYPATEKHISKYESQEMLLIEETPDDYQNITLPHINSQSFSIQWVYNILEKKSEAERIVFEDPDPEVGFVLVPDMKWDGKQAEDLYLVAIAQPRGIKSLRDLNASHLPLLENIQKLSKETVRKKYDVAGSRLRLYLHYQPSYYHLHVHVTHLRYQAPGSGCERGHLLADVINNLQLDSAYYSRRTLSYVLKANEPLAKKYADAGKF